VGSKFGGAVEEKKEAGRELKEVDAWCERKIN